MNALAPLAAANSPRFALVPVLGRKILAARVGDEVIIPMRSFCASLDLPWDGQRQRIARDRLLKERASMMLVPSEGGEQRQTTLPLDVIPGFLFGLDERRFAPELRDVVLAFRRECYAVLYRHFLQPRAAPVPVAATPIAAAPDWREQEAARRASAELITLLSAETRPQVRRLYHAFLVDHCAKLGREAPALAAIGVDADLAADALRALLGGLDTLTARRVKWNHAASGARVRLAINLLEIARLFARNDIDVRIDDALRAALTTSTARWRITVETVRSAISRRPVHCYVLAAWA